MVEAKITKDESNSSFLGGSYETRMNDTEGKVIEVIAQHFKISDRDIHLDSRLSGDLKVDHRQITDDGTDLENKLKRSFEIEVWDVDEDQKEFQSVRDVVEFVRNAERRPLEIETPKDEDWHPDDPRWLDWEKLMEVRVQEIREWNDESDQRHNRREKYKTIAVALAILMGALLFMTLNNRNGDQSILDILISCWWQFAVALGCYFLWQWAERWEEEPVRFQHFRDARKSITESRRERRVKLDEEARWNANK